MNEKRDVEIAPVDGRVRQPKKSHINRLERMAEKIEREEAMLQKIYGNRIKGSTRSSNYLDAKAIRAVVDFFDHA